MKRDVDNENSESFTNVDELLRQLGGAGVPPAPAQLDAQVHRRLNAALLATQLFDFVWHALPYAFVTMLGSVNQFLALTMTGKFKDELNDHPENNNDLTNG